MKLELRIENCFGVHFADRLNSKFLILNSQFDTKTPAICRYPLQTERLFASPFYLTVL